MDWGAGRYESTAVKLEPAAERLVAVAQPEPGEHVVDIGCGTGNAALLAAARGAHVTGIDPAPRLLEAARKRANAAVDFVEGDAASIPLPDDSADVLISAFGVIFAPDTSAAADEMARVAAPRARIVLSAWLPYGAIFDQLRVLFRAVAAARDEAPPEPRFAWHDEDAVSSLLAPHGFVSVNRREEKLSFTADSATAFLDNQFEEHPMFVAGRVALDARGEADSVRRAALDVLERANESASGDFCVTSDYAIVTARRG